VNLDNADFYQSSFTAEGWIKPAAGQMNSQSPDSSLAVFTLRNTKNEADTALSALVLPDGRFRVNFRNPPGFAGGIDIYSDTKLTDGQWHHFAIVNDNDHKLRLYIDGDEEAISDVSTSDMEDTNYNVLLGMNVDSNPRFYKGLIDEIRFWRIARTREEIARDLSRRIAVESEGLVAAYDFEF